MVARQFVVSAPFGLKYGGAHRSSSLSKTIALSSLVTGATSRPASTNCSPNLNAGSCTTLRQQHTTV